MYNIMKRLWSANVIEKLCHGGAVMFFSLLFLLISLFMTGCCSNSNYDYQLYRKRGEDALLAKKYIKAKNYYSVIYEKESKKKKKDKDSEKTNWAFYRLGVIAELTGDLKRAKGYYWGDSIKSGFYADQKLIGWFAQTGWKQIDEKNKARSLEDILAFEKTRPLEAKKEDNEEEEEEIEKEVIIPKKTYTAPRREFRNYNDNDKEGGVRLIRDTTIPPPPFDAPDIFQFYDR